MASTEILRAHRRISGDRVGYLGLSQRGHVAPLAGVLNTKTAFVSSAVGSLLNMEATLYDEEVWNAFQGR